MKKTAEDLREELYQLEAKQAELIRKAKMELAEARRHKRTEITKAEKRERREQIARQKEDDHEVMCVFRKIFPGVAINKENANEIFMNMFGREG